MEAEPGVAAADQLPVRPPIAPLLHSLSVLIGPDVDRSPKPEHFRYLDSGVVPRFHHGMILGWDLVHLIWSSGRGSGISRLVSEILFSSFISVYLGLDRKGLAVSVLFFVVFASKRFGFGILFLLRMNDLDSKGVSLHNHLHKQFIFRKI